MPPGPWAPGEERSQWGSQGSPVLHMHGGKVKNSKHQRKSKMPACQWGLDYRDYFVEGRKEGREGGKEGAGIGKERKKETRLCF